MNVDFSEILDDPRFQSAIGPYKLEQYSSDETGQQMIGDFENESQTLMTLIDNGGGNSYGFYNWHGFYFWNNAQSSDNGASDNLEDLFDDHVFETPPDQIEIESVELPIETLCKFTKKLLITSNNLIGWIDTEICINGKYFKLAGDELVEV
jgi:hypothetical protein